MKTSTFAGSGGSAGLERLAFRLAGRPLFWLALVLLVALVPVTRALRARLPPRLPVLGQVPDFSLDDQHGHAWGSAQLRGRVWVADFIDTRCPASALSTETMRSLQHRARNLADALHLVTIALAPEHDDRGVLLEWSRAHGANPRAWSFLSGDRAALAPLLAALGAPRCEDRVLVLVDGALRKRAVYRESAAGEIDTLLRDAGLLVNRGD